MSTVSAKIRVPTRLTLLGNIHPNGFVIESVFVGIESTERRVAL